MRLKKGILLGLASLVVASSAFLLAGCTQVDESLTEDAIDRGDASKFFSGGSNDSLVESVKKSLSLDSSKDLLTRQFVTELIHNWYKNNKSPIIKQDYEDFVTEVDEDYDAQIESYEDQHGVNAEWYIQNEILDPVGGTEARWKLQKLGDKLYSSFSTTVLENLDSYLYLSDGTDKKNLIPNPSAKDINLETNVNANPDKANYGGRNNFVFGAEGLNNKEINADKTNPNHGYADFVNFAFEDLVVSGQILPVSMALFNQSAPVSSTSDKYFDTDNTVFGEIGTEGSYKFQVWDEATRFGSTANAQIKYDEFIKANSGMDYVDVGLKGALNIPISVTDDSATAMLTPKKTSTTNIYTDWFLPTGTAAMYKFNTAVTGTNVTAGGDGIVKTDELSKGRIFENFFFTDNTKATFELSPKTTKGLVNDYVNVKYIRDGFDVTNGGDITPYFMVRNEKGTHILGIDRYQAISEAADKVTTISDPNKTLNEEKYDAAYIEVMNTLAWRTYQTQYNGYIEGQNGTDITESLQTHISDNKDNLILKYFIEGYGDTTNLFSNTYLEENMTDREGKSIDSLEFDGQKTDLVRAILAWSEVDSDVLYQDTIKSKFTSVQSEYVKAITEEEIVKNGLAGVLPFSLEPTTGNYKFLDTSVTYVTGGTENASDNYKTTNENYYKALNTWVDSLKISKLTATQSSYKYSQRIFTNNYIVDTVMSASLSTDQYGGTVTNDITADYLSDFYDYEKNQFKYSDGSYEFERGNKKSLALTPSESTNTQINDWISWNVQNALIKSKAITDFTASENLFSHGNWGTTWADETQAKDSYNELYDESKTVYDAKYNESVQFQDGKFVIFDNSYITSYYDTIMAIQYLLTPTNVDGTTVYTFENFTKQMNSYLDRNDNKGVVAWVDQEQVIESPNYGAEDATPGQPSKDDFEFDKPVKLMKQNQYSYSGSEDAIVNPGSITDLNSSWLTLTNDTNYWNYVDGMTGFKGFQFETGLSSLPSEVNEATFDTLGSNTTDNVGALYHLGTRNDLINSINKTNTLSGLNTIAEELKSILVEHASDSLLDSYNSDNELKDVTKRQEDLVSFVKDTTLVPEAAFTKLSNQAILNGKAEVGTQPFVFMSTSEETNLYGYQIRVTQFRDTDVDGLFNEETNKINFGGNDPLSDFLMGISEEAFFMALIQMAQDSTVSSLATAHMINNIEKLTVYDQRLKESLGTKWVKDDEE